MNRWKLLLIIAFITIPLVMVGFNESNSVLQVSFLDIGQGDAIFIQTPNDIQMLIDGGRDERVLKRLNEIMPLGDNSIDIVLATHPDADHIGGLDDVIRAYDVGMFIEPGVSADTKTYESVFTSVKDEHSQHILGTRGMVITLDPENNITFAILYPYDDVTHWETNDASIVGVLTYGEDSFLLTGDAPIKTEYALDRISPELIDVDVLKLGHHGSRTSSSEEFLRITSPEVAIISAGKDNSYGHPHQEVLSTLKKLSIPYLATADQGTITFTSKGEGIRRK